MPSLYALNIAINLMVGAALLLAWWRSREETFSRDLGLAFLALSLVTPGFIAWSSQQALLHGIGGALLVVALAGHLTLLVVGSRRLSGQRATRHQALLLLGVLVLTDGLLLALDTALLQALNAVLNLLAGLVICWWLRRRGNAERLAGLLFVLLGLNLFQSVGGGLAALEGQVAVALALRVALALTLLFAAFTRSSERARLHHTRFLQLTERSHQGVGVMRGETVLYANPAVHKIYGVQDMQEHSQRWRDTTMPAADRAVARERHRAILAGEIEHAQWEGQRRRIDGSTLHLRFSAWRIDWDGEPAEQVVVTDITAEQNALSELLHHATHDALTGLPNRSALLQRLRTLCGEGAPFALIVLDVDRFALFNEAHGPSVGDQVLVALANALLRWLDGRAELMRLGEDEFALLLRDDGPETAADALCASVRQMLQQPLSLTAHEFFLDVSMGIALHPATAHDPDALLRAANAAMHEAKRTPGTSQQRAEVRFEHGSGRLLQAEQALRAGIEQAQFFLVYQPKVDAATLAPLGFEALVRWRRGDDTVLPADFIPAAEHTGLIVPLGSHILALACAQLAAWRSAGLAWLPVAVNVSPLQLLDPGFPDLVLRTLARFGVPPTALSLEITETAAVTHMGQARGQIAALREQGIEVALDDFGVGFSSLNMLRSLPLHTVKIDRSLIEPMPALEAQAVVRTVCALAAPLHLKVVAEGVETAAQATGCAGRRLRPAAGVSVQPAAAAADAAAWLAAQPVRVMIGRMTVRSRPVDPRHAAPPLLSRAAGRRHDLLHRQRDAGHGRGLADGRSDRLVVPGRAGADGGVPADVPAGAARRRDGRHHRPPPPDAGGAGRADAAGGADGGAVPHRLGGRHDAAAADLPGRLLHGDAEPELELGHRRRGAARRAAAGHHRHRHRLQQRARPGPGAGRATSMRWPAPARCSCSRCSACWRCSRPCAAFRRGRTRRRACRPNGCGAACSARCVSRATARPCWRSWCAPWPTAPRARRCGRCCR